MKKMSIAIVAMSAIMAVVVCCGGFVSQVINNPLTKIAGLPDIGTDLTQYAGLETSAVPAAYRDMVQGAGQQCELITAPVIAAQIEAESNWNPDAESPGVGAQGIAQFMPGTWATHGKDGDGDGRADVWNPADAIHSQAGYDCDLAKEVTKLLGSGQIRGVPLELTLAAYNAGLGNVKQAVGVPNFRETRNYIKKIIKLMPKYTAATVTAAGSAFGLAVVQQATRWLGTPYVWGGGSIDGPTALNSAGVKGFDCSSLVQFAVYHASGGKVLLKRVTNDQVKQGIGVPRSQLQIGDAIYVDNNSDRDGVDHVGMYAGNNKWIHAPQPGDVVKISTISDAYWATAQIRRFG